MCIESELVIWGLILAATKQLYEWFSLSVCPSVHHTFLIIVSSWKIQELLPMTDVIFMQKVKVIGQRWR